MIPIVCDIDGVLADWNRAFRDLLRAMPVVPDLPEDPWTHWDWPLDHLEPAAYDRVMAWIADHPAWLLRVPPYAGIEEPLIELHEDYHTTFVTARPGGRATRSATVAWLAARGVPDPHVLVVPTGLAKVEIVHGLEARILIEDRPLTVCAALESAPALDAYLIERPYNAAEVDAVRDAGGVPLRSIGHAVSAIRRSLEDSCA